MLSGDDIREAFLSFFEGKGHSRIPSSSLIPAEDPTLLLTNAGMVQLKPYFTGELSAPNPRLVSVQKCFRTTDIESVGDTTHLTFFEMLGNFSVGDYFKEQAIGYAWAFLTDTLSIPGDKIWITIYHDDDEAHKYWVKLGLSIDRIRRFGDEDNFWGPAGSEGPCGPCSELHYDFGAEYGCQENNCGPNCGNIYSDNQIQCDRFVEIWNLVFMQYYQFPDGKRELLPRPNIDTGMGLERCAVIMQGKRNIYETDIFSDVIQFVSKLSGKSYGQDHDTDYAIRVISEHVRSATFLIGDGVVPGNYGRDYVLRRLIRRAIRYGKWLGMTGSFLPKVSEKVVEKMGIQYPDLIGGNSLDIDNVASTDKLEYILSVLDLEQQRFDQVFEQGNEILGEIIGYRDIIRSQIGEITENIDLNLPRNRDQGGYIAREALLKELSNPNATKETIVRVWLDRVSGPEAFVMYDTYGFPVELTEEISKENGMGGIDRAGFDEQMDVQRDRARVAGKKFDLDFQGDRVYQELRLAPTEFVGYQVLEHSSVILALILDGVSVDQVSIGDEVQIILNETPFYPEMGGQVGDTGTITSQGSGAMYIEDTQNAVTGLTVHYGKVMEGRFQVGDQVRAQVDHQRREDTARNHTATHMLHAALREILGDHVRQHGSLVSPDRLRFDFTHVKALDRDELIKIQLLTNQKIRDNIIVESTISSYKDAVSHGALAFFGDRYGDVVRDVNIGNDNVFSQEMCGGTHVRRTGDIGYCHVLSESGIGSGIRRIEALTGRSAETVMLNHSSMISDISKKIHAVPDDILPRIGNIIAETEQAIKRNDAMERELLKHQLTGLPKTQMADITVMIGEVKISKMELMREAADWFRSSVDQGVLIVGSVILDRPAMIIIATPGPVDNGFNAGDIVNRAAKIMGGGGGGRPDLGQAGGKDANKLLAALAEAEEEVRIWQKST